MLLFLRLRRSSKIRVLSRLVLGSPTRAALAGIVVDPSNSGDVSVQKERISGNKRELKSESRNNQLYAVQYNIGLAAGNEMESVGSSL